MTILVVDWCACVTSQRSSNNLLSGCSAVDIFNINAGEGGRRSAGIPVAAGLSVADPHSRVG